MTEEDERLRTAYDAELRGVAEVHRAIRWDADGPLFRAVFHGPRGFVTYPSLGDRSVDEVDALIVRTIAFFRDETDVTMFEWKTRGHDAPACLHDQLNAHAFEPEERETVMIGEATRLAEGPPAPPGISIRRIGIDDGSWDQALIDAQRMLAMQAAVFGDTAHDDAETFIRSLREDPEHTEGWIAEADDVVVCAGRLQLVPGTAFAGLWGGATHPDWRHRGIYRALCAARARAALAKGVRYLHSDSTEYSRPILERSGFRAVTTTTPFIWRRPDNA